MFTNNFFITPQVYTSTALETTSLVTGATAQPIGAKLLGLVASNNSASNGWIQIFDGFAQPATSSVPILSIQVAANSQNSLDCGVFNCLPVNNGIVVVLSSTLATYTPITNSLFTTAFWIV